MLLRFPAYVLFMFILLVAGCSFSSSSSDQNDNTATTATDSATASNGTVLTLALRDADDKLITALQTETSAVAVATLKDVNGVAIDALSVNFASTLASLAPADGVALTNDEGQAQVTVTAGTLAGQAALTADILIEGETLRVTVNYAVSTIAVNQSDAVLNLSLVGPDANETSAISSDLPGTLLATLSDANGNPMKSEVISFTTDAALLNPASGKVLTDANGLATLKLLAGDVAGAGTVTASVTLADETSTTARLNYQVLASATTSGSNLTLQLFNTQDSITSVIRADEPGVLRAVLSDGLGIGIAGVVVTFSTELATLNPTNGTTITNADGQASVQIIAANETGANTVSAVVTVGSEPLTAITSYEVQPPAIRLGSGVGGAFVEGELSLATDVLSAGTTTSVTANIVDLQGDPFEVPVNISFSSSCSISGKSLIDDSVTTVNGQVIVTYEANGCEGVDIITASAQFGGSSLSATTRLNISADSVGTIEFVSATPAMIALRGMGGAGLEHTSEVTFRVKGVQGLPLANQQVNFSLNTDLGGLSLLPASQVTNSTGLVSTIVQAGVLPTSVRVTASVVDTDISAQSNQLVVSTGFPDQNSVSLAFSVRNPEALNYDGEVVTVTARLADLYNNPVPDGTAVYFTTEGGAIAPQCETTLGACSVTWTSQQPHPIDHRVTVLATAIGHESFKDENGDGFFNDADGEPFADLGNGIYDEPFVDSNANNFFDEPFSDTGNGSYDFGESFVDYNRNGRYDGAGNNPAGETDYQDRNSNGIYDGSGRIASGDDFTDLNGDVQFAAPGFVDLSEAYVDENENSQRDIGEPYLDFDLNGQFSQRDGQYNGILCRHNSICSSFSTLHVRRSAILIMSSSQAYIVVQDTATGVIYGSNNPSVSVPAASIIDAVGGSVNLRVVVTDTAGQTMPMATTIASTVDVGEIAGTADFTVPDTTTTGHVLGIGISDNDITVIENGFLSITVASPKQTETVISIPLRI